VSRSVTASDAPTPPLRYAVLASGGGSNFQALLDAAKRGDLNARAVFLACNNSTAGAMEKANQAGVPAYHVSAKTEGSEAGVSARLLALIDEHRPDLLVLAGYMKKVPDAVLARLKNRIVNIHPALLPEFGGTGMYGHHVHEAVVSAMRRRIAENLVDDGRYLSGMTIHMVNEHYDEGQYLIKRAVDIYGADASGVAQRVLELEHDTYWRVLQGFATGAMKPTDSDDPAEAVRVSPSWIHYARTLTGTVFP